MSNLSVSKKYLPKESRLGRQTLKKLARLNAGHTIGRCWPILAWPSGNCIS